MSPIILEKVNLGATRVKIPVADISHGVAGRTILVTAGMDGDEYAGILAAYRLIDWYGQHSFAGRLIIVPAVNLPGFFTGVSRNPIDNKFPKHIFPGKSNGSSTERLMDWLSSKYVCVSDIWIDLHSGAATETLTPFVWIHETGKSNIDTLSRTLLRGLAADIKVYTKHRIFSHEEKIAKRGASYILLESGQRGEQNKVDIDRHVNWVRSIVGSARRLANKHQVGNVYSDVSVVLAAHSGVWESIGGPGKVKKGRIVGSLTLLDQKSTQLIKAPRDGVILWVKFVPFCNKGDELFAIAWGKGTIPEKEDRF